MNASNFLMKYCLNATQCLIDTISSKNNMYNVKGFKEYFIDSSECQIMLTQSESDIGHFKKLLDDGIQKLSSEYKISTEKESPLW